MKIYVCHSGSFDYETDLYIPLKQSSLVEEHEIFLPHAPGNVDVKTKDIIVGYDLMIGEVTFPSTGQGIEIGLAVAAGVPIVCFYRQSSRPSSSLRFYCENLIQYADTDDMLKKITEVIEDKRSNFTR